MNSTQHPLVSAYLDDLARMLIDLDPGERAEVLAGVREHVDASLTDRSSTTDQDVRAVLAELGPPEAVAQEAYAGRSAAAGRPAPAPAPSPLLARKWVPVTVAVLQVVGVLFVALTVGGLTSYSTSEVVSESQTLSRTVSYDSNPVAAVLVGLLAALPFWVPVAVLVGASPLWSARRKTAHMLLLPATALLVGVLPALGWRLTGTEGGIVSGGWAALALVLVVGGWLLWRLTRHALRRLP
jgi:hypothetical protein